MRLSYSEIFSKADSIEEKEEKIEFLRKHYHPAIAKFLSIVYNKKIKWHVPTGIPPIEIQETQGSVTRLYYETGKLYRFYDTETSVAPKIPKYQRERMFIEMLQELSSEDVKLLCLVKDKKWPYKTLTKQFMDEAYPGVIE